MSTVNWPKYNVKVLGFFEAWNYYERHFIYHLAWLISISKNPRYLTISFYFTHSPQSHKCFLFYCFQKYQNCQLILFLVCFIYRAINDVRRCEKLTTNHWYFFCTFVQIHGHLIIFNEIQKIWQRKRWSFNQRLKYCIKHIVRSTSEQLSK